MEKASLTGDAEITVNRGKRKHIYDFSATVNWELEMAGDADDLKGSFAIEDVSGDREYEIVTKVNKPSRHTVTNHIFNKYIKSSASRGNLQHAIVQALDKFYDEFKLK
jgi:activator of HSP90 ATPase